MKPINLFLTFLVTLASLAPALPARAQTAAPSQAAASDMLQVVFLVDHSGSMNERAFGGNHTSRWDVVRQSVPEWLAKLPADAHVGMATVGGSCGSPPVAWRRTAPSRDGVLDTLNRLSPNGQTPLNAVLERIPDLFAAGAGPRKVVLLSDGGNSCAPQRNTCELARELYNRHRIAIEIVAFVADPALASEFQCIAQVTGGSFVAPSDLESWTSFRIPTIDPWPPIVFTLGMMAAVLTATVVYRHVHRAFGVSPRRAALAAGAFLAAAGLVLATHLLLNLGATAALLGAALVASVGALLYRRRASLPTLVLLTTVAMGLGSFAPSPAMAQSGPQSAAPTTTSTAAQCLKRQGPPMHHVIVVDVSGSVYAGAAGNLTAIKERATLYLCNHAQAGDSVSLVTFGRDEQSSAAEAALFELSAAAPQAQIAQALDEIRLPDPKDTRTYFSVLRAFLDGHLRNVRHMPSVVVFSDGVSDNPTADEPLYGAFGRIYPIPNATRVKVAYRGPAEIDPADVFNTPLPASRTANVPAIQACLIDPPLAATGPARLDLSPSWWTPFGTERTGILSVSIKQDCVDRVRKVGLRLVHDQGQIDLGTLELSFGPTARRIDVEVRLPASAAVAPREARLMVALNPGTRFERKLTPTPPFALHLNGWLETHGLLAAAVVGAGLLLAVASAWLAVAAARRRGQRPLTIRTALGQATSLSRNMPATIGGSGAMLALPDVPAGQVLARATWDGNKEGVLLLTAESGVRLVIDGVDVVGQARYVLGSSQLRFSTTASGSLHELVLHKGNARDLELGGTGLGTSGFGTAGFGSGSFGGSADRFGMAPSLSGGDVPAGGLRI